MYMQIHICVNISILFHNPHRELKKSKHDVSKVSTSFTETSNDSGIVLEW